MTEQEARDAVNAAIDAKIEHMDNCDENDGCRVVTTADAACWIVDADVDDALDAYRDAVERRALAFRDDRHPSYGPCDDYGFTNFEEPAQPSGCSICLACIVNRALDLNEGAG